MQPYLNPGLGQAMKTLSTLTALLAGMATASSQSFTILWSTLGGGGGTSTGGVYSLSGTLGQADAGGPLTNGIYSVTGGFWAFPTAVQTPGTPALTITPLTPGQARISWSPNTSGFILQETASPSTASWGDSPSGALNPVNVPAAGAKFYRLRKP